jgi:hypothetical protein
MFLSLFCRNIILLSVVFIRLVGETVEFIFASTLKLKVLFLEELLFFFSFLSEIFRDCHCRTPRGKALLPDGRIFSHIKEFVLKLSVNWSNSKGICSLFFEISWQQWFPSILSNYFRPHPIFLWLCPLSIPSKILFYQSYSVRTFCVSHTKSVVFAL